MIFDVSTAKKQGLNNNILLSFLHFFVDGMVRKILMGLFIPTLSILFFAVGLRIYRYINFGISWYFLNKKYPVPNYH